MSGSAIIDITVGLLLFFLVLSLICSAVQEWIASVFGLRSRNLRKGIDNLLGAEIAKSFYNHGLLKSLYRRPGLFGKLKFKRGSGPSYIEPRIFADVLVDVIDRDPNSGTGRRTDAVTKTIQEIETAIKNIQQQDVREALLTLLADAKNDTDAFRRKAADWFDAAMDRVSGWYARSVKLLLFAIAAVVVFFFNADAIEVATKLWKDEALRASLVAIAKETVPQPQPAADDSETGEGGQDAARNAGEDNAGEDGQETAANAGEEENKSPNDDGDNKRQSMPTLEEALKDLEEFPVGWNCAGAGGNNASDGDQDSNSTATGKDLTDKLETCWSNTFKGTRSVVGWLISIVACSFGAPFWFGLLSKVVSLRGAGKAPVKPANGAAQT